MKDKRIVLHIITGLADGGAEGVLNRLCLNSDDIEHIVISLTDEGKYGAILIENGIQVICMNMGSGAIFNVRCFFKLFSTIKSIKPDVVQTWMYHADLIGGVASRAAGVKNVFWGIRHSTLERGESKTSIIVIAKLCSYLSYVIPKKIICCAHEASKVHEQLGYNKKIMSVIENGFDLELFKPDNESHEIIRDQLSIGNDEFLIGTVGRFDPQKDHFNLLRGLSLLKESGVKFKCVCVGNGLEDDNLASVLTSLSLDDCVILSPARRDIANFMSALDLHVLPSSYGEGFPNVVAESMACETPNVVTNVGDSSVIVGDVGWCVPVKSPELLAQKINEAILLKNTSKESWKKLKKDARLRILNKFTLTTMIDNFKIAWGL